MELQAQVRTDLGRAVKKLRKESLIPAEFYGRGFKNQTLAVRKQDFDKVLQSAGESTVITLLVDGAKHPSIIHDVQYHSISGDVIHADFYGVHMDEKIRAHVEIEFIGEAPAVKTYGGVLNKAMAEIEVEALPADLPSVITVDVSGLMEIDQSIYIKDVDIPENVKVLVDAETAVATVMPPVEEEVVVAPEVDVSEVKVETDEKKAERMADKEGTEEKDEQPSPEAKK
jgi:large subunit ribosomal protein L25